MANTEKKIEFNTAQKAMLGQLCEHWNRQAQQLIHTASVLKDEAERSRIESRAHMLQRNARDLRIAFSDGDLPAGLGFQVRAIL